MKITKRQLKRIIREEYSRLLNEYGSSRGRVSWFEDTEQGVLFDIEGVGEDLTQDEIYDILEDADEDLEADIRGAMEDYDDYMYSS